MVLDIAAGTGEPGLSIARHLHGGKVVVTDLAEHMPAVAREKAAQEGIPNVEFREADADTVVKADVIADMTGRCPNGNIDGCGILITGVK